MINGILILTLLLTSNVALTNGFGAIALQRNKNNFNFVILNSVSMFIIILSCSSLYGIMYTYVLEPYNLQKMGLVIIVLFASIANFGVLELIKLLNKEMYYYYDITYSFIINLAVTIAILYVIDFSLPFGLMISRASLIAVGYILANMLFALIYPRIHNKKVSKYVRPVPITILVMSAISMIIYAISISIN